MNFNTNELGYWINDSDEIFLIEINPDGGYLKMIVHHGRLATLLHVPLETQVEATYLGEVAEQQE